VGEFTTNQYLLSFMLLMSALPSCTNQVEDPVVEGLDFNFRIPKPDRRCATRIMMQPSEGGSASVYSRAKAGMPSPLPTPAHAIKGCEASILSATFIKHTHTKDLPTSSVLASRELPTILGMFLQ